MRQIFLLSAAMLAGCTVGPDYAAAPAVASDAATRGTFVRAADPALIAAPGLARWWETLSDPTLNALVDDALAHNPTIDEAIARIRAAQAQVTQKRASQLPSVSANATYLRAQLPGVDVSSDAEGSGDGGSTALDFYNLGLNASWELDLFGGGRRAAEQSRATAGSRIADLADTQVSLSAQVAQAYVDLRDVQAQIRIDSASTALQQRQVGLAEQRLSAGTASVLDVERLRNQLENTQAEAIPLASRRDEYLNQLAVLTGRTPGALDAMLGGIVPVPLPPARVAIGDPAALIANRPDIRSAERMLAASTAAVGVSKAKQLPGIRFLGILGLGGTSPADVFDPGKLTMLLAPSLSWSFLDFGRNRAATRVSQAERDGAQAAYRRVVLAALQDAETALSRFGSARARLGQLAMAEATAARSVRLNGQRVQAGTSSVVDQLDIERRRLSASTAAAQARGQLAQSYIAVNKALGLGWSTAPSFATQSKQDP